MRFVSGLVFYGAFCAALFMGPWKRVLLTPLALLPGFCVPVRVIE
jgi:hypothetical protein